METKILIENIKYGDLIEFLNSDNIGILIEGKNSFFLLNHSFFILDLTKELAYAYNFMERNNKLDKDQFLKKYYQNDIDYCNITIENVSGDYPYTMELTLLITKVLKLKFNNRFFIFSDQNNTPFLIL